MIAPVILNAGSVRSVTVIWATAPLLASLYFASGLVEAGKTETDASGDKAWMEQARGDIACDVCGQVATHIWASLVNAWPTHSGHGDYVREKGPAEMAREMLKDVCDAESYSSGSSPVLEHIVKMYYIHECGDSGCRKGQHWQVAQDEKWFGNQDSQISSIATENRVPEREQLEVYKNICGTTLLRLDEDFASSFKDQFESVQLEQLGRLWRATGYSFEQVQNQVSAVISDGLSIVGGGACHRLCQGKKSVSNRTKSKTKSKRTKTKLKQSRTLGLTSKGASGTL